MTHRVSEITVWLLVARYVYYGVKGFARNLYKEYTRPESAEEQVLNKAGAYVLKLTSGLLYVGASAEVGRRVAQHFAGRGAKVTQEDIPLEVVEIAKTLDVRQAMIKERELYDKYVAAGFEVKGASNTIRPSVIAGRRQ